MNNERLARIFFGATSLIVWFALVLQLGLSITADSGSALFESTPDRIVNVFSFFTVLSNIAVAATTGLLAIRLHRDSTLFRVLRLDGLIAIAVTGVVFHLTLAQLQELTGWSAVADFLLHTLSPILCTVGWLVFGPRGALSRRIVLLGVIAPVCWLVYALVRGALVQDRLGNDYYAYPFMSVHDHGFPIVLVNVSLVAVLFLAISFGALALDRRLPGVRSNHYSIDPLLRGARSDSPPPTDTPNRRSGGTWRGARLGVEGAPASGLQRPRGSSGRPDARPPPDGAYDAWLLPRDMD